MGTHGGNKKSRNRTVIALIATAAAAGAWGLNAMSALRAQPPAMIRPGAPAPDVFTPAHRSMKDAVSHFFGFRPVPEQPIPFPHQIHVEAAQLTCTYCHDGVTRGPVARIPSIALCMGCHEEVAIDRPAIQKMTEYYNTGQDAPWQRVYGWNEEAHVRFNHAPHIRAEVQCATCHGDVSKMGVAERAVNHTMGFCVSCHEERKASNDCLTCHY